MKFLTICTVATLVLALTVDAAPSPKLTKRRISKQNPELKTESTTTSISSAQVVTEGPQPTVPAPVVQHPTTASPLQAPGVPQIPELVSTAIPTGQLPQLPGQNNGTSPSSTTPKPEEEGEEGEDSSSEEDPDNASPPDAPQQDDDEEEDESQEDEENSVEDEDDEARSHIKTPAAGNAIVDDEAQEDGSDSDEVAEVPIAAVKVSSTVPKKKPVSEKKTTPVKPAVPVKEVAEVSEESAEEEDGDDKEAAEVVEEEKEAVSEEAEESASVGSSEEVERKKVKKPSVSPVVAASIEEPVLNQNVDATGEIPFIRPPPLALVREKVPTGEDDEHEGFIEKARFYLPEFDDEEPRVYSPYNYQPYWLNRQSPYNNFYNNW